jgi:hypothetical protein
VDVVHAQLVLTSIAVLSTPPENMTRVATSAF